MERKGVGTSERMIVSQMEEGISGLPKHARFCEATLSGGGSQTLLEPTMIPVGNGIPPQVRNKSVLRVIEMKPLFPVR